MMARVSFRTRKTLRLGPAYGTVTHNSVRRAIDALTRGNGIRAALRALFTSYGTKTGRVTHNRKRRTTSIDTHGPGSVLIEHDKPVRTGQQRPRRRRRRS